MRYIDIVEINQLCRTMTDDVESFKYMEVVLSPVNGGRPSNYNVYDNIKREDLADSEHYDVEIEYNISKRFPEIKIKREYVVFSESIELAKNYIKTYLRHNENFFSMYVLSVLYETESVKYHKESVSAMIECVNSVEEFIEMISDGLRFCNATNKWSVLPYLKSKPMELFTKGAVFKRDGLPLSGNIAETDECDIGEFKRLRFILSRHFKIKGCFNIT